MFRRGLLPILVLALTACDGDAPTSPRADAANDGGSPADAMQRLDAMPPPMDAAVRDAGRVEPAPDVAVADAEPPRDARVDAELDLDAQMDSGTVRDGAVDAARVPDAEVDAEPPDACVGVVLPPPPPSVNGEEVCNYVDDDGDGLVDEGFEYRLLAHPVSLTQDSALDLVDVAAKWNGRRFGVAWNFAGFVTAGSDLCPTSEPVELRVGHERANQVRVAQNEHAFAVAFTAWPFAYVQFFSDDGVPFGPPHQVGDGHFLPRFFLDVTAVGESFAVFAETPDGRGVYQLMTPAGEVLHGPLPIIPREAGIGFDSGFGIAYDGEAIGLAWEAIGGATWNMFFIRWRLDGEIVTPPTYIAEGYFALNQSIGIEFREGGYLVPHGHVFHPGDIRVANIAPGPELQVQIIELTQGYDRIRAFATTGQQYLVAGDIWVHEHAFLRTSRQGQHLQLSPDLNRTLVREAVPTEAGPSVLVVGRRIDGPARGEWRATPQLQFFGCGDE